MRLTALEYPYLEPRSSALPASQTHQNKFTSGQLESGSQILYGELSEFEVFLGKV